MKSSLAVIVTVAIGLAGVGSGATDDVSGLKAIFAAPPQEAKPQVWWHWMNGNVSKSAITSDLESLADAGIGGVQLFDIGCGVAEGPVRFNTPEWDDHVRFAAAECTRLGLDLTLANCSGWTSSGGPWVKPEDAMKYVTHTETRVKGGTRPPALPVEGGERTLRHYYRDVAVLAFPVPKAEREGRLMRGIRFSVAFDKSIWDQDVVIRVGNDMIVTKCMSEGWCDCGAAWGGEKFVALPHPVPADTKVSFELPVNCHHDPKDPPNIRIAKWRFDARAALPEMNVRSSYMRGVTPPAGDEPGADAVVAKDAILDLSDRFDPQTGMLDWTAPASAPEWAVLRIGCACRAATCSPATPGGAGLEVDKLDASAVARHFDAYVGKFVKLPAVKGVLVDSYEVGSQNWTPGFEKTFERRFGYSILPYLACFSLRIVDSAAASEKAFADFRLLLSERFAENYAGTMTRKCETAGVAFKVEPYGNSPADDTLYARRCHVPMMEFWAGAEPGLSSDMANHLRNAKAVASAAHIWGRPVIAAEAFTGHNKAARWIQHPYLIKGVGDWFYAHGANRMVWNHFTHQPYPNALPGIALGPYGTMFAAAPWWPFAKPWVRYEARCQAMLQAGRFAPDLLYYLGDEAPQSGCPDAASVRFDWDAIGREGLAALKVSGGRLVAPSGVTYARLVMPPRGKRILPESAREIARLKAVGAEVVAAEAAERGLEPDFVASVAVAPVRAHHRIYSEGVEGYFVASSATNATKAVWSFRQARLVPSIWDPETGKVLTPVWRRVGGRCELELDLRPCEALFVMFTREQVLPTAVAAAAMRPPVEITKWTLRFPSGKGCLAETNLTRLVSWTVLPGETKFFSGIAEYETEVTLEESLGPGATLDLGEVHELAEVTVNGKTYDPLWRPPYRLDLSDQHATRLKLRVRVANCWPNRLIGDAAKPLDRELNAAGDVVCVPEWVKEGKTSPTGRQTFTFHDHWRADEPLRPAGLMGPVVIR